MLETNADGAPSGREVASAGGVRPTPVWLGAPINLRKAPISAPDHLASRFGTATSSLETRPKKTIKDIITQVEPELFEKLSRLTRSDFKQLDAGVFNDAKMNDAVWKFRSFEEPSLPYELQEELDGTVGGLTLRRDERFAHMIDKRTCERGDELHGIDHLTAVAVVTDNTASASAVSAASPSMRLQRPLAIKVMDGRSGGSTMVTARSR